MNAASRSRYLMLAALLLGAGCTSDLDAISMSAPANTSGGIPGSWSSQPLGNGDVTANVWCESSGESSDVFVYLGRSDAFDEMHQLLKVGLLRVHFNDSCFFSPSSGSFNQTLSLSSASVQIRGTCEDGRRRDIRAWIDALSPVLRLEIDSGGPFEADAEAIIWRNTPRPLSSQELGGDCGPCVKPNISAVRAADKVFSHTNSDQLSWYHRNGRTDDYFSHSSLWESELRLQGLWADRELSSDPLTNRTFGCSMTCLEGSSCTRTSPTKLSVSSSNDGRAVLGVAVVTAQTETEEEWTARATHALQHAKASPASTAFAAHTSHWEKYWSHSYVKIRRSANPSFGDADMLSRQLAIHRYTTQLQTAASVDNVGPGIIKFNGGILNTDAGPFAPAAAQPSGHGADFRDWAGGFWLQNTRHSYWPMLASGDARAQMLPLFAMIRAQLPLARARSRVWFAHDGAIFPETQWMFGTYLGQNYGCDRGSAASPSYLGKRGQTENSYIRRHWTGTLEMCALALDYYGMTQNATFAAEMLPVWGNVSLFFLQHFDKWNGQLVLTPAQALETYQEAINPADHIAGLIWLAHGLEALPASLVRKDSTLHGIVKALIAAMPSLPVNSTRADTDDDETETEHRSVLPAEYASRLSNSENPDMYAVHPFRLLGINRTIPAAVPVANRSVYSAAAVQSYPAPGAPQTEAEAEIETEMMTPETANADGQFLRAQGARLAVGRNTYRRRRFRSDVGEWQDIVQAAFLGLADECARMVVSRFELGAGKGAGEGAGKGEGEGAGKGKGKGEGEGEGEGQGAAPLNASDHNMLFPGFFGVIQEDKNWFPDDEHPAQARMAVQSMLLQSDGRRILLFPAWPKAWSDVEFKLHTFNNTIVEVICKGGHVTKLHVTPPEREADIVWIGSGCTYVR